MYLNDSKGVNCERLEKSSTIASTKSESKRKLAWSGFMVKGDEAKETTCELIKEKLKMNFYSLFGCHA